MLKLRKTTLWKMAALAIGIGATSVCVQAKTTKRAAKNGDILFSARFYLKPETQKGASHFHLYRINADGSGKRQITFGSHDDQFPIWALNGRRVVFVRDDKLLLAADENGENVVKLRDISSSDSLGWNGLKMSSDGQTVGIIRRTSAKSGDENTLFLTDIRTKKARQINGVEYYSWSSDNRFLALEGGKSGFRVLDLRTQKTHKIVIENLGRFAWISPTDLVATIQKAPNVDDATGVESLMTFNMSRVLRTFQIPKTDGEFADWRSFVTPIPSATNAFTFVSDESTSSGYNATYFRVSTISAQMTRLAEGQSFAWSPNGLRFLNVTYHDTTPYDTLPNGHKRVVYTTKLQVGTSENTLRDLVSGLVLVESCDWR